MTDDELERALFSLPLEAPPAGLRERILAATVYRTDVAPAFRTWELWLLALAVVVAGVIAYALLSSVPDFGGRAHSEIVNGLYALGFFSVRTYAWFAVGVSVVWAISSLTLMPVPRRTVYNR